MLGSLALFAGCGSSGGSDFIKNIQKEVNWILNNNKPDKTNTNGIVKPNVLFNLSKETNDAIQNYTSDGTAINNDKVNLNVKQILGYYEYQISDNSCGVETSVLVNDSKVSKPTKDTFKQNKTNFANNFILNFSYLVNKDNKATHINDATNADYFNFQNIGNSIDHYVNTSNELNLIKVNDKFDIKNQAFDPITKETDNKGALFVDQRTNWVSPIKDNKKSIWSLPNETYWKPTTLGKNTLKDKIKTIKDITDAPTLTNC